MTLRPLAPAVILFVSACAGAVGGPAGGATPETPSGDLSRELDERSNEQARRIGELEARIALLEQEARRWRDVGPSKPTEPVRIGRHVREEERARAAAESNADPATEERDGGPIPSLRLVGEGGDANDAWSAPSTPPGMPDRLPVVPLPAAAVAAAEGATDASEPGAVVLPASAPAAGNDVSSARGQYRAALKLVREREFDKALDALARFLAEHPDDAFTDDAMYWRAEVHYAERRYREALDQFAEVLSRFPTGSRVPDALLKVGMCHRRLGDASNARAYFRRVREEYPDTEAARLVPQEGST